METLAAQMPAAFNLINSRSLDGLVVAAPLCQPMGYWPQPQNPSYPVGSAFAQQWPKYMGRPLNSLSMDFQTRNTNSLTPTKALPSPYDNLSLFPTYMGSSGVQQQQRVNASQQPSLQPTPRDFIHTPDHCGGPPLTSTYYSPSSAPQRSSFPPMKQSPNISHSPSNRISPLSNVAHDRPFKCDQCPQSFNRNHDLKRHKRIHLAVKPFPCGHCEKSFSRKDALKVRSSSSLICSNWSSCSNS